MKPIEIQRRVWEGIDVCIFAAEDIMLRPKRSRMNVYRLKTGAHGWIIWKGERSMASDAPVWRSIAGGGVTTDRTAVGAIKVATDHFLKFLKSKGSIK